MESKKRKTTVLILLLLLGVGLVIAYALTKNPWIDLCLHSFFRLLCVWAIVRILGRVFREQLAQLISPVTVVCSLVLVVDLVIVEGIRFYLKGGVSTILFLPACLPLTFMIVSLASSRATGKEKRRERLLTLGIGIPLFLFSLYLEVLSFLPA